MISDLYFIPILRDALAKQDREPALIRGFQAIECQGRIPCCKRGYAQFLRFMDVVAEHAALVASASAATEPVGKESEDAPDVTTATALREILGAEPSEEMAGDGIAPPSMGVIVEKDGKPVKDVVFILPLRSSV